MTSLAISSENTKYIADFISGAKVRATPEEADAVQVFARRLVEIYDYDKEQIQTRPQFRVRQRPSDERRSWPIDIAVFKNSEKTESNLHIVVECKKKTLKTGLRQLQSYLEHSPATIGVWFNGDEHAYIQKIIRSDGSVIYRALPNIAKKGQRIEDIGLFTRADLKRTNNLKSVFKDIRNHLAGNMTGITRDQELAPQIIILLFCKIFDELNTAPEDIITFRAGVNETQEAVFARINYLFESKVKTEYNDVFDDSDTIRLDPASLVYVVGELQNYCITEAERDVISDAFQVFISPALTGPEGQFFTPRNVVGLLVSMADPDQSSHLIDPACGSGGFLITALETVWGKVEEEGKRKSWSKSQVERRKIDIASRYFVGIDKDRFLAKVTKAYMALIGDGRGGVFCDNSLKRPVNWTDKTKQRVALGKFRIVLTNPPFGQKLKVEDTDTLNQYLLARKFSQDKKTGEWTRTNTIEKKSPQTLFVERCLDLLGDGGLFGVVLPESMFCNPNHKYIMQYIKEKGRIKAIVSMPEELFQPYTHAKTVVVMIEKGNINPREDHDIFMAIANWCGHDSRGSQIPHDDIPKIQARFEKYRETGILNYDHLGFIIQESEIVDDIYLPKYYNPEIPLELNSLKETHTLTKFSNLIKQGLVSVSTGDEVGKLSYGTGNIPFVRTSDISNWEIKLDPKHGLSNNTYELYAKKQDVQAQDIFMVRDGTYLVGTCAMVTEHDGPMVYQSHMYKIRSKNHKELNPYLLLAVLSSPIVKKQIFAKRFTQDIIDTLGSRINELILPFPKNKSETRRIIKETQAVILTRAKAREKAREIALSITPSLSNEDSRDSYL